MNNEIKEAAPQIVWFNNYQNVPQAFQLVKQLNEKEVLVYNPNMKEHVVKEIKDMYTNQAHAYQFALLDVQQQIAVLFKKSETLMKQMKEIQ